MFCMCFRATCVLHCWWYGPHHMSRRSFWIHACSDPLFLFWCSPVCCTCSKYEYACDLLIPVYMSLDLRNSPFCFQLFSHSVFISSNYWKVRRTTDILFFTDSFIIFYSLLPVLPLSLWNTVLNSSVFIPFAYLLECLFLWVKMDKARN